jgi:hypothetical protein
MFIKMPILAALRKRRVGEALASPFKVEPSEGQILLNSY